MERNRILMVSYLCVHMQMYVEQISGNEGVQKFLGLQKNELKQLVFESIKEALQLLTEKEKK